MLWTTTTRFRTICRIVLCLLVFQSVPPATWRVPWKLDISFDTWPLNFGPTLAYGQSSDPNLAATPDANKDDPFIIQKAQELGNNPVQIFNFVRDEIGYESYKGSLRGARGTLWSKAGNALDQASLLIALLRASNIPARYLQGTLPNNLAQQLILSMFPAPLRVVGCLDPGTEVSDPANDPKLLAETREHYWVEFNSGGGFQAADPTFVSAQIGQTFTGAQDTFTEVPDNLRHKVTVGLKREITIPATGLLTGGASQGVATVLEETLNTVELVGRSLSVGHFVNSNSIGAIFTSTTHTYSPYLVVNERDGNLAHTPLIRGQDYQEMLTNFPFGSQILTGLFLEVSMLFPQVNGQRETQTLTKTLLDRIGFAARQGGRSSTGGLSGDTPAITDLDVVTLEISATNQIRESSAQLTRIQSLIAQLETLTPQIESSVPEVVAQVFQQASQLSLEAILESTSLLGSRFQERSNEFATLLADTTFARAYFDSPRVIAISNKAQTDQSSGQVSGTIEIDILRNATRSYAAPFQARSVETMLRLTRGMADSVFEGQILEELDESGAGVAFGALDVFLRSATVPGSRLVALEEANLSLLSPLAISDEAKARITRAVKQGKIVIVPSEMVDLGSTSTVAWLESDVASGETIAVSENGTHQGIIERVKIYTLQAITTLARKAGVQYARATLRRIDQLVRQGKVQEAKKVLLDALKFLRKIDPLSFLSLSGFVAAFKIFALDEGGPSAIINGTFVTDPPAGMLLFSFPPTAEFASLAGGPVAIRIIPDPLFTVPLSGAQLPTVFRAGIKNTGAATDTFSFNFTNVPTGFTAQTSVPQITIPPGQTAEVGICLRPTTGLPAPGTPASFTVNVVGTSASTSDAESFTVPEIHGVTVTANPPMVSTTPGVQGETTLTIQSVGNVAENVTFATDLPANLTLNGLSPVSLSVGQTIMRVITLTPNASVPLNSTLTAQIAANFGAPEPQTLLLPVRVVVPGADAIASASVVAGQLGNISLTNRLNDLSIALTNLVQNPSSDVFKGQALASLDSVLSQLANNQNLSSFVNDLTAARNALAAANTASAIQTAVNSLGTTLDAFAASASGLAQHNFEAFLLPNSQTAQPQTPTVFELRLHNIGTDTTTYNVSLGALPSGVTGQLSQASVTLDRDEFAAVMVTLTQTATAELLAFNFAVTVSAAEAPSVSRTVQGALTVRNEFISVVEVSADPPFTDPGGQVNVSARLLNGVNQQRQARVSYIVQNPNGQTVFTSLPVQTTLTVQTSLVTLALGALDTTGFTPGQHSIAVTVTDLNNTPIPGATGEGSLLIGSPVTATISVDPDTLPPGDGMVTNRLQVSTIANVGDPLTVVGHLPIDQFKRIFEPNINDFLNGLALNLAQDRLYVLGSNGFHVVNVADPTQPLYVRNKAFQGFTSGIVDSNRLIVMGPGPITTVAVNARGVLDYIDLGGTFGTADDPGRIQGTNFPYQFAGAGVLVNTHLFVPTFQVRFDPANNDIFSQNGTVLSFSVDPARVFTTGIFALEDALLNENGTTNDATFFENGGNFNMFNMAVANPQTLLVASTTSTGTNTQTGVGRILVVDMSAPNNINSDPPNTSKIVGELQIPGTVHVHGLALDGNLAFAVASQGGWLDQFVDVSDIGPTGNLVLATIDITDPRSPQLMHSVVIPRSARGGGDNLIALGNHRFAFSSLGQSNPADTPQLFVVDASNPNDIVIIAQLDVPGSIRGLKTDGTFLYATGDDGLTIYQLGGVGNIPVTAQVRVPKNTGVAVVPNSFSIPPTSSISGTDFDTLVWEFTGSQTVTWQSTITNLQPGEAREATLETTVDFTFQGTPGQITLPPTFVTSQHILAMDPSTRTVPPGEAASYTLTVKNPTAGAVTYALSVQGIPLAWVDLAPSITVPVNSETNVALTLTSDPFAALVEYGFVVTASTNTGATGSVQGSLLLQGAPVLPTADPVARGVVVSLTPAQATAGQGTPAHFVLRLTNTGSTTDTFTLTAGVLTGVTATLEVTSVEVPPGASNFRDVSLTLTPQPGSATGNRPFTVTATSATQATVHDTANGTVTVVGNGVDVALTPTSGPPSSTYQLRVTNTGQGQDTFDLAAGGPGALVATLGTNAVTLASGASQNVPITVGAINFAYTGNLALVGIATSRGNQAVQDSATATVTIAATQSITARFDPASVTLPTPGAAAFLLLVDNTGNTEDAYTAAITGTIGPITPSLNGLDGQPTQTIPLFRLPGLSSGALVLDTTLTAVGQGMVTVRITSQTNAAITASATATVQTPGGGNRAPVAHAGRDQTLPLGETVLLDGSTSTDPDNPPAALHFQWSIAASPPGSALTNAQISDATTARAAFTPDVIGDYTLRLIVSDGALSAADEVLIHVQNTPPVAEAGPDRTAKTGMEVTLNGSDSFDPNGDLITYDWTLVEQPAGSALTSQSLTGRQTPKPTFTPDRRGRYVFELIVNDGLVDSEPDTVAITASPSNVPPNADAGPDQHALVDTAVVLDGSASHDPDQSPRPLIYQWTFKQVPAGSTLRNAHIRTATQAQASFVPDMAGTYVLNLRVSDGSASGNDEVVITASASNVPPNADASEDQTVTPGAEVALEGLGSHDPDNGPAALSYTWRFVSLPHGSIRTNADIVDADLATARFTPDVAGSYVVRLEVFDGEASAFDNVLITATPCIERVTASPNVLWPPNHKMVPVTVGVSVSNRCPAAPVCQISSVRSNEPVNGLGDGDTAPDWEITGALTVRLRAERSGQGSGRVYTITVSCTEGAGHNATGTTTVQVPHDQGKKK